MCLQLLVIAILLLPFRTLMVPMLLLAPSVLLVQRVLLVLTVLSALKVLLVLQVRLAPLVLLVLLDLVLMALRLALLMSHPSMALIGENIVLTLRILKPNIIFSLNRFVLGDFLALKWQAFLTMVLHSRLLSVLVGLT
jgi:hypothetical protein